MVFQWVGNVLMAIVFGSALYKAKDIMKYIDFYYMSTSLLKLQDGGKMNDTVEDNSNEDEIDIPINMMYIVCAYFGVVILAITIICLLKKKKLGVLPIIAVAVGLVIEDIYLLIDGENSTGLYIFLVIIGIVLLGVAIQIFSYIDGLKS